MWGKLWAGSVDAGGAECGAEEAFGDGEDGFLLGEGHFEVDLGELGLAVGAEVFVAEAAGDLEVAVEAGDHEDLFEDLGGLGEGEELAGVDARGDEVVAGALGGGAGHAGGFDFEEALFGEVVADSHGDFGAHDEVVLHGGPAEVDVAVFEADFLVGDGVFGGGERGCFGVVEEEEVVAYEFDFAGGQVGVGAAFAGADCACDGDDVLGAGLFGFGVGLGGEGFVENDLGDAGAVAEIEEDEVAVVAAAVDPAHEGGGFGGVGVGVREA